MLTRRHRLTDGGEFARAVRGGVRGGSRSSVVHLLRGPELESAPVRVGFVVGKAVGGAVTRNHVKRRLRHLVRGRLGTLPTGVVLVIRALPAAAEASYAELANDLDKALARAMRGGVVR